MIDLGGAVGLYTLMCARKVGPAGHVYAFEPDPSNASYLRRNVALNHYQDRVTVIEKAASAEPVKLRLYLSDENGETTASLAQAEGPLKSKACASRTLCRQAIGAASVSSRWTSRARSRLRSTVCSACCGPHLTPRL